VPDAVHFQPAVGQHFSASDQLANSVDKDLAAAAGHASEASVFQTLQHGFQGKLAELVKVVQLGRAEAVNVDLRKSGLQTAEHFLVPLQRQLRM
jgi:hypothetical protein